MFQFSVERATAFNVMSLATFIAGIVCVKEGLSDMFVERGSVGGLETGAGIIFLLLSVGFQFGKRKDF